MTYTIVWLNDLEIVAMDESDDPLQALRVALERFDAGEHEDRANSFRIVDDATLHVLLEYPQTTSAQPDTFH
ncbi:MAG: hypothetical protein K2X57_29200 [Xanthobacteraceae bacterium]|nr:hypothetical protein [Xanthobacteraceae bacterium]